MVHAIAPDTLRRVLKVQAITVAWMSAEAAVSLFGAWRAKSPALLAFGGDSAIELASAVVVLWRFRNHGVSEHAEGLTSRIAGALLIVLAAFVVTVSMIALLGYSEPKPSLLGVGTLIAAAVFMPLLAREKRRLSAIIGSAALRADAAESTFCGYLSVVALLGLVANAVWHIGWADPAAALVIVPLILREGWGAFESKPCC